jgi:hypothetical protein
MRALMLGLGIAALLLAAVLAFRDSAARPSTSPPAPAASSPSFLPTPAAVRVPTATPAPLGNVPTVSLPRSLSVPTANPAEQAAASLTRLYLTAFQNGNVSVIDPLSGHALHEITVEGDQAGGEPRYLGRQ